MRKQRLSRGEFQNCPECGYDLSHTSSDACPECGTLVGPRAVLWQRDYTDAWLASHSPEGWPFFGMALCWSIVLLFWLLLRRIFGRVPRTVYIVVTPYGISFRTLVARDTIRWEEFHGASMTASGPVVFKRRGLGLEQFLFPGLIDTESELTELLEVGCEMAPVLLPTLASQV